MYHWWPDAGWHFSNLGGVEAMMDKISATSHSEQKLSGVDDPAYLKECLKYGVYPNIKKERPSLSKCNFAFVKLSVYPEYLRKIMLENPQYIVTDLTI